MWRRILVNLLVWVSVIAVLAPANVLAQEGVGLSALEVDLWPEYDRPEMLVIYRVSLPATVSLPVDLTFRIPTAAGEPSAVAVRQTSATGEAGLFSIPYEYQVDGEWGLVNLTATMPEVQIEYYDPGLEKQGAARQFDYRWPGDYAVDSLSIQVQQPLGSRDLRISPAAGNGVTGQDGFVYYTKQVGSLEAGQGFDLQVDYQKDSDTVSAENLQVQPSAPMTEMPSTGSSLRAVLPWVLGILGVALIAGGGVWYWQSGKGKEKTSKPRRRRSTPATVEREATPAAGHIYCHQCGKRAGPGDRFCRTCGSRLRVE